MCMYINTEAKFKKAEYDIIVYKVMRKHSILRGLITWYTTPYTGTYVPFMFNGRVLKARGEVKVYRAFMCNEIERGIIHTYTKSNYCSCIKNCVAFECIIPKGTEYIESMYGEEIGAKKIKFVKQIK